jgi:hypothetical protein
MLNMAGSSPSGNAAKPLELVGQINPDLFRLDGNLNAREIPISLQLPDWNSWLPRVHPKDAWGSDFAQSEFAALYDGETAAHTKGKFSARQSLYTLVAAAQNTDYNIRSIPAAFAGWSQARRAFLKNLVRPKQ